MERCSEALQDLQHRLNQIWLTTAMSKILKLEDESHTEWARPTDEWNVPRPACLLNGAFDILHIGHMRCVRQAKARAQTTVVALDSDRKIHDTKGVGRPVMCFAERAAALGFLEVDFIVEIDTEEDMRALVEGLRPDFRIQGSDYLEKPSRFGTPKLFVQKSKYGVSTSEIIRRCKMVP